MSPRAYSEKVQHRNDTILFVRLFLLFMRNKCNLVVLKFILFETSFKILHAFNHHHLHVSFLFSFSFFLFFREQSPKYESNSISLTMYSCSIRITLAEVIKRILTEFPMIFFCQEDYDASNVNLVWVSPYARTNAHSFENIWSYAKYQKVLKIAWG